MSRDAILLKVRQIAADLFARPLAEITPDSSPSTVSTWDSLQQLNLVLALEQAFDVNFSPEDIVQFLNIELIALIVEEKIGTTVGDRA